MVKGPWRYLEHAVDKYSQMIDFLRTAPRYEPAARPFLTTASHRNDAVSYARPGM